MMFISDDGSSTGRCCSRAMCNKVTVTPAMGRSLEGGLAEKNYSTTESPEVVTHVRLAWGSFTWHPMHNVVAWRQQRWWCAVSECTIDTTFCSSDHQPSISYSRPTCSDNSQLPTLQLRVSTSQSQHVVFRPCSCFGFPLFSYWRAHPEAILALLGYWCTLGEFFGLPAVSAFGRDPSLLEALSNTRSDGIGALYREGTASLLNSLVHRNFALTTQQVREEFNTAVISEKAAATQAQLFKKANEGHLKHH
ncbi:hypothetical protein BHE74_00027838 [Ensete ventricosum]|nr:hypothetical protein BHE74_00027838 [Ensete ventricosum]